MAPGKTYCLLGSSAWQDDLINQLLGRTPEIARQRHRRRAGTPRRAASWSCSTSALLIDMPGMRELATA